MVVDPSGGTGQPFGVDVVLVEPGLIQTDFGRTAAESVEVITAPIANSTWPSRRKRRTLTDAVRGGPDAVARVVERAIKARAPRTRYVVTFGAHAAVALRWLPPDRAWDFALRAQFTALPRPSDSVSES